MIRRIVCTILLKLAIRLVNASAHCCTAARWCALAGSGVSHRPASIERTGEAAVAEHLTAILTERRTSGPTLH